MKKLILIISLLLGELAFANPPGTYQPLLLSGDTTTTTTWDSTTLTGGGSLSGGDLTFTSTGAASVVRSKKFATTKFYFELTITTGAVGSGYLAVGVIDSSQTVATPTSVATTTNKMWINRNDAISINNGGSVAYGSTFGAGRVMSIAVDNTLGSGSGKIWVGQCSGGTITWPSSGDPPTGANAMYTNLTGNVGAFVNVQGSPLYVLTANFGATSFSCPPPTGYGYL